ncbi:hypothetical protein CC2G_002160 [Coprinopsis cinerea AmutBmut pab1-1]|nr:hypothetical protein CC2G_002160 [Coprinopsis cinerea AmutBmut pab1-1]
METLPGNQQVLQRIDHLQDHLQERMDQLTQNVAHLAVHLVHVSRLAATAYNRSQGGAIKDTVYAEVPSANGQFPTRRQPVPLPLLDTNEAINTLPDEILREYAVFYGADEEVIHGGRGKQLYFVYRAIGGRPFGPLPV